MSVIFIGDRAVGKTTLMFELAKPSPSSVKLPDESRYVEVVSPPDAYEKLKERCERKEGEDGTEVFETRATTEKRVEELIIKVKLPTGKRRAIEVKWVDTPGDLWEKYAKQQLGDSRDEWEELLRYFQEAQGIILVLAPHANRIKSQHLRRIFRQAWLEEEDPRKRFLDYEDWLKKVDFWLNFLRENVKVGQQAIICLNKADLFCEDCDAVAQELPLDPEDLDIRKIQDYLLKRYFQEVQDKIASYNKRTQGNLLNVFITTKDNRRLLESPWIYLARLIRN